MSLPIKIIEVFKDPNFFDVMVANFLERWNEMGILLITIPGSSCYGIGYRVGTLEKWMFNVYYNTQNRQELLAYGGNRRGFDYGDNLGNA